MKSFSFSNGLIICAIYSSFASAVGIQNAPANSHISLSKKHLERRGGSATQTILGSESFWFGNFTVGGSSNLSMLIDTGSGDVIVNPGLYVPGKSSQNLNATFANVYGTTSSNGTGNGMVVGPLYADQVNFDSLSATQVIGLATGTSTLPGDGIVGFSGPRFTQFPGNSTSFFQSLCTQGQVTDCRFGLALHNGSVGSLILGELDTTMYTGSLTVAPILTGWALTGDLAINGNVIARDLTIELDSGTGTIVGPIDAVTSIFATTGIQGVLQNTTDGPLLTGYFPCDKPPTVGFSFPSQTNASTATGSVSHNSTVFNIPTSLWSTGNNGGNNCTAVMSGQDYPNATGLWVAGQPFFQGIYIDYNLADETVGFAPLKTLATMNTTSTSQPASAGYARKAGVEWAFFSLAVFVYFLV